MLAVPALLICRGLEKRVRRSTRDGTLAQENLPTDKTDEKKLEYYVYVRRVDGKTRRKNQKFYPWRANSTQGEEISLSQ